MKQFRYTPYRDGTTHIVLEPLDLMACLAALQIEAERLLGVSADVLTPKSLPRGSRVQILRDAVPV